MFEAGERQVLAIVGRDGSVTPKTLMTELHISKATATRRLADLVRKGYLHSHGKGRATTYVLANDRRAAEPIERGLPADVEALLREHAGRLGERYAVSALGLVGAAGAELRLLAQFARTPDLFVFFELEGLLGQLLGRRVDLMPAEVANSDVESAHVVWLDLGG
jgi:hypothetical protein